MNPHPEEIMTELITQVTALLKEVAAQAILPRYRALHANQIQEKEPGDYVTAADLASEAMLKEGLSALLPGSQVVGEEEISANPGLLLVPNEASWNTLHHTLFGD